MCSPSAYVDGIALLSSSSNDRFQSIRRTTAPGRQQSKRFEEPKSASAGEALTWVE